MTVQGHWTSARLDLCLPYLQRFLYGSPRKNDACSPIRSVLSWTNLLPFPLLDLEVLFATCAGLSSRLWGTGRLLGMIEEFDPNTIEDERVRQVVIELMNLVESLSGKTEREGRSHSTAPR